MKANARLALIMAGGVGIALASRAVSRREPIDFKGRVVVITGGSRGLGLVMARELAAEGARLTICARDAAELERAERDLAGRGAEVLAVPCDVRDRQDAQNLIERTVERFGRIDVLINNAGIIHVGPLDHMALEEFEDAMATHMWGPLYTSLAAVPHMRRQGGGRIVNISSIGGKISVPHLVPYCTSKFALVGLSDGMRAEFAKDNIFVTTVCPWMLRTGAHVNSLFKGRHRSEFTWFSIIDSLPLISVDAHRAALKIIEACRRGDPVLLLGVQSRLSVMTNGALPRLMAGIMALFNRMLPDPTTERGNELRTGWESQSALAPSLLTRLSDQATEENNGLRGHPPIV